MKNNSITRDAMKGLTEGANPKPTPTDLQAQELSTDPAERARQLAYQAQCEEMLNTGGDNNG